MTAKACTAEKQGTKSPVEETITEVILGLGLPYRVEWKPEPSPNPRSTVDPNSGIIIIKDLC